MKAMIIYALNIIILVNSVNSQSVPNVCFCATSGNCNGGTGTGTNTDGTGNIDIRIQTNGQTSSGTGTSIQLTSPASTGIPYVVNSQVFCQNGLERCCPSLGYQCGRRYPPIVGARQPTPGSGQANYGAYPWLAVIMGQQDFSFQGTGALIDHMHVLTVAHKLNQSLVNGQQFMVQLGRWDGSTEVIPYQTFNVLRIFTHPSFNPSNLQNDIAILRLSQSVNLGSTPTIGTACLPTNMISGVRCMVAGYGSANFGGQISSSLLKEVDLPLVDQFTCQSLLRSTRLGQSFILDAISFVCAGGELGKDACTGDGGAPLVCQVANQWYVFGLVAWGIGCGSSNVPGVYVNVVNYISWIQQTTISP
ncbi:inactive CLIP domain-containing serine protease A3-like isoform X2 [Chironomus tepperi]|uniref:inactive CLIP domain-containing serine protease A3-like isoform X2 n=1 Tax=Chironomus tepperi TaxID=113505 RepID=UPI00391F90B4